MKLCAVIPVYRHAHTVGKAVEALLAHDLACIVVDDGNGPEDAAALKVLEGSRRNVEVVRLECNSGKGAAIQSGLHAAGGRGFTHALQIDADGQHDTRDIARFIQEAREHPDKMICGVPVYDDSVPRSRLYGRYLTHVWVWINTLSLDIRDSMCGFRIYPLAATLALLKRPLPGRMEFDSEVLVRLHWRGVRFRQIPTRVVYPEGGISHFRLLHDNVRISWMHTRLFFGMLLRLPLLLARRLVRPDRPVAHWASIGENTWVGGILFLMWVHRWFGRGPFRVAVLPVVLGNWLLRPAMRRASKEYLARVARFTPEGRKAGALRSIRHVMNFAETMLDKLLAAGGRYPTDKVRTEGREALYSAISTGRGAVIVTAHVGCLELCQRMAEERGTLAMNILVHTRHAEKFNRILRRLNPHSAARLMEVTDLGPDIAMRLSEKVSAGECVIIAGDRIPVTGGAVVSVPFLGEEAKFPVGPYVLAGLFECPLFFMSCTREAGGHVIRFDLLSERVELPRRDRSARIAQLAQAYARALEAVLVRSPVDWFNFFDFWKQGHGRLS